MLRAAFISVASLTFLWSAAFGAESVPSVFEINRGQSHPVATYLTRGATDVVFLDDAGLSLVVPGPERLDAVFTMRMTDGDSSSWRPESPLAARINYLRGPDPKKWVRNVETFERIRAVDVWPGVDIVYSRRDDARLRFDFVIDEPKSHSRIHLSFPGADQVIGLGEHALVQSESMVVRLGDLFAYQDIHGERVSVDVRFIQRDGGLGFALGPCNPSFPVVIDPTIDYTTYLGGDARDMLNALDLDAAENVYIAGTSAILSTLYPTTVGAYQVTSPAMAAGVLTKLDPNQTGAASLVYSTFISGTTGTPEVYDVSVDTSGRAHIVGLHNGVGFPTTAGAEQTSCVGSQSFVAIVSADGSTLDYSSCLFTGDTRMSTVEVHPNGNTIIAGVSTRVFTVISGSRNPLWEVLIMRIDATAVAGSQWPFQGTIGGAGTERLQDLVLDSFGRVVIVTPGRAGAPVTAGAYQTTPTDTSDLYIAKIDTLQPVTSSLVWGTFAGGPGIDDAFGGGNDAYAIDSNDDIYVASLASAFPTTPGAISSVAAGPVVFKLSSNGQQLLWSTYLGLPVSSIRGLSVGPAGEVVVVGRPANNLPASSCAVEPGPFSTGAFVARINPSGSALQYLSYLPGTRTSDLLVEAVHVGAGGAAFTTGVVRGAVAGVPIIGGFQSTQMGSQEGFFMKLGTTASCGPDACGSVTFQGECAGTVLTFCEEEGTAFERLVTVDCATDAFPASVRGVCTQIDPAYGFDCAVAEQEQCDFTDRAGDPVFGLCQGSSPGCVIDPSMGNASCTSGVGVCDEVTFSETCAGDYLLQACQVVQPVAVDCGAVGASCVGAQCTGVQEGFVCDVDRLICDGSLLCHGPTNTCEQAASVCDPNNHQNTCEGTTLVSCHPRSSLKLRIDCPAEFVGRGTVSCGPPYSCVDDGSGRGCANVGVGCVVSADNDACDVANNIFCGPARSCVYIQGVGRALEGRCQSSSNFQSCTVGAPHVGCEGDIATFCVGSDTTVAVEPGGFDCASVGSTCSVEDGEPVCLGGQSSGCQDPSFFPSTLYRCRPGFQCEGAIAGVLGSCVEVPTPDGGSPMDQGMDGGPDLGPPGDLGPADSAVPFDGGVVTDTGDNSKGPKDGCGCRASHPGPFESVAGMALVLLLAFRRRRRT